MSNRRGKKRGASLVMSVLALVSVMIAVTQAGQSGVDTRIHDGTEAERGEFPFLACLYKMKENEWAFQCGGSIIDEHHILTAAHCIPTSDQKMVAKLGCHERSNCTNAYKISAHLIHPNYYRFDRSDRDDIAILRTEKPIEMTGPIGQGSVGSIELPKRDDFVVGEILTVAGWGATSDEDGSLSDVPMKANRTTDHCEDSSGHHLIICSTSGMVHVCGGDSGGPVFRTSRVNGVDKHKTLLGIVALLAGTTCDAKGWDAHTRVASYLDWIEHSISYSKWWAPQLTA